MDVLALYDIHGNPDALDAVLADPRAAGPDAVVVGGDAVPGPFAAAVLDRLDALAVPVHRIRGNGEREVADPPAGDDLVAETARRSAAELGPERTRALVLFHAIAKGQGLESEAEQRELADLRDGWGLQEWCDELLREGCPSLAASEHHRRWFANWLRVGASPAVAYALNRAFNETDLGDVLPAVRVPTLLLYRSLYEAETMDVASRISNARTMRVSISSRPSPPIASEALMHRLTTAWASCDGSPSANDSP